MNILSSKQKFMALYYVTMPDNPMHIGFFVANCDAWKYRYDDAKKIFQTACQGEIDLWDYAESKKGTTGTVNGST